MCVHLCECCLPVSLLINILCEFIIFPVTIGALSMYRIGYKYTHTRARTHAHARTRPRKHTPTHAYAHARTHAHAHTHTRLKWKWIKENVSCLSKDDIYTFVYILKPDMWWLWMENWEGRTRKRSLLILSICVSRGVKEFQTQME